jgi:DUF2924 family protein
MESMKSDDISQPLTLQDIKISTVSELRESFEAVFHVPLQQRVSLDFMKGNLAWVIQAKRQKINPKTLREKLIKKANAASPKHKIAYQPGTRLVREWQGHTYEVTIMDNGYQWQGNHYRSLTAIAHEITGTKWSGPRFFGLNDKPKSK